MLISMSTFFELLESDDFGALMLWHSSARLAPDSTLYMGRGGTLQLI